VTVIVACGITAPDGSVMRPRIVPVVVCAASDAVRKQMEKTMAHERIGNIEDLIKT
jgi:hypothetical protein